MPQGHNLISCPATGHQQVPLRDWVLDLWRSGRTISYRDGVLFHELAKEYKGIQGLTSKLDGLEHGASALVNTEKNTPARKQPQHAPWIVQMTRRHGPFGSRADRMTSTSAQGVASASLAPMQALASTARISATPVQSSAIRLFDQYLFADYSGAEDDAAQRKAIYLCAANAAKIADPVNGFTRESLRCEVVQRLSAASCAGQRVLFGFDHQYSWPSELWQLAGLAEEPWEQAVAQLIDGTYGGPACDGRNPVDFGSDFNRWVQRDCFYSLNHQQLQGRLPAQGLKAFRLAEVALQADGRSPMPATRLRDNGAVGGQTLRGLPHLLLLKRELAAVGVRIAYWPFDGLDLSAPAYQGAHVGVEVYPTLLRPAHIEQTDANDARACAVWAQAQDASGKLGSFLDLRPRQHDEARIRLEGWVLGVAAIKPPAVLPQLAPAANSSTAIPNPSSEQQAVIESQSPLLRVIARAGTGKTFTMVRKAVTTLQQDPAARVAMLTFTRNAADEMRQRFRLAGGDVSRFEADTFHGFALKRLLARGGLLSLGEADLNLSLHGIRLLNEFDRNAICEYLAQDPELLGLGDDWYDKLSALLNKQDPGTRTPAALLDTAAPSKELPDPARLWRKLLAFYARERLLDFDGIMVFFEFLLRTDSSFLQQCSDGLSHIFLDEFQDTNLPQLLSLQHLAGYTLGLPANPSLRQIAVVGDDFQTIYSFRGAVPGIFDRFAAWSPQNCQTLGLRISRRSDLAVLDAANATARRLATHRDHSALCQFVPAELLPRPEAGPGQSCDLGRGQPEDFVAAVRQLKAQGLPLGQITCLAYANGTLSLLKDAFDQAGLPAFLLSTKPKERPGIRRFLAFLQLWIAPESPAFSALWELCSRQRRDFDALWQEVALKPTRALDAAALTLPEAIRPAFLSTCRQLRPAPGLEEIFLSFTLQDPSIHAEAALARKILKLILNHPDFAENPLRLIGELTRRDFASPLGQRQDEVQLSTIHQFKGLEDTAILLAPDIRSNDDGEKLRMEYVARTRGGICIAKRQ